MKSMLSGEADCFENSVMFLYIFSANTGDFIMTRVLCILNLMLAPLSTIAKENLTILQSYCFAARTEGR